MRQKPNILKLFEALDGRMTFTKDDLENFDKFKRGFEVEVWADKRFEKYGWLIIKSLTFHLDGEYACQIDTIIITGDAIILYEIKYYSRKSTDRGDRIQYFSGDEENPNGPDFKHPRLQLKEATIKFKRLLTKLGISTENLKTFVMFTHKDFVLYNMKEWSFDLIFHSEVDSHIDELATSTYRPNAESYRIYNLLKAQDHDTSETMPSAPKYNYEMLRKVVKCPECGGVIREVPEKTQKVICPHCSQKLNLNDITKKALDDYQVLFKETPTIEKLYEWCGGMFSKMRCYRAILASRQ